MKKIIKNISEIIQVENTASKFISAKEMKNINTIKDAYLEIDEGKIVSFGSMNDWKGITNWNETEIIDAEGGMIFPTYCDSHTHLVFSHSREKEFIDKINGLSYQEIAKKGGGILNSVEKLRNTSEEELYKISLKRLNNLIQLGTGAIEIKSGYGLDLESELKMLRVIKRLKKESKATIKSTLLSAHAVPKEFQKDKQGYIKLIVEKILPQAVEEKLIDFIDVFCEKGYFTVKEMKYILKTAEKYNIKAKTHVNQFNSIGGVKACVELNAISVDHLETMEKEDYNALLDTSCMPTILPGCSFFLNMNYGPARKMIDKGIPIALASDFNPGSSPSGNMNFIMSLGCIKLKMSPEEVINSVTINSAYAMGVEKMLGSICIGKKANFFITKPISSYGYIAYNFGENVIDKVFLEGEYIKNPDHK